ncbi:hypothetical protein NC653_035988 [Populus alba x Populus x berolinensis]|uniref:Uncharacterized protein n=1 Tax=Populus alba x Populus x berolinensis TaxID=444605 RepID=A0AAD6LJ18_9ROSI|nr:hypothetical protein NC653_035988 [Populus alba x Populus x berolinensis]
MEFLTRKYEEASKKLKNQLPSCGIEILNLKKQIVSLTEKETDHQTTKRNNGCL